MSEEIKVNRPQQPMSRPEMPEARESMVMPASKMPWIILVVVVLVLLIFGALFREKLFGKVPGDGKVMTTSKSGAYQAVFLTNGQVYFGKITTSDTNYVSMKDIYYLQVVQPPLQGTPQQGQVAPTENQQPQISLVKLGNELHGPVDEMHITRAQILFYEDLKSDGNVVKAIDAYKANPTK